MDKIAIIGCGGSGKTVLARQLGDRLGIPVTHLDELYYDTDWSTVPAEKFAALQRELVARPRWVIDGNYATTMPIRLSAADTVIYLDVPARTALWSIVRRRLRYRGGQHPDGVYDRITWGFICYILNYRRTMGPRVRALLDTHATNATVITLRSRTAARRWLDNLKT